MTKHSYRTIATSHYCIDCGYNKIHSNHYTAEELQAEEDKQLIENYGDQYSVEYDGFIGSVIGHYITREGKRGTVLQLLDVKVVHVYNDQRLTPSV